MEERGREMSKKRLQPNKSPAMLPSTFRPPRRIRQPATPGLRKCWVSPRRCRPWRLPNLAAEMNLLHLSWAQPNLQSGAFVRFDDKPRLVPTVGCVVPITPPTARKSVAQAKPNIFEAREPRVIEYAGAGQWKSAGGCQGRVLLGFANSVPIISVIEIPAPC